MEFAPFFETYSPLAGTGIDLELARRLAWLSS